MRNLGPIAIAILLVAVVAGSLTAAGVFRKGTPAFLAAADYIPSDVSEHDGWWYWIERPLKARVKLLRAKPNSTETLAEADEIPGYSAAGDVVVWSARNGSQWSVNRRSDGRDETLWAGSDAVGAPRIAGQSILWAATTPGVLKENITLPALGPRTALMVSGSGSGPRSVGNLLESGCDVVGARGDSAYVACHRYGAEIQTAGYEISLTSGGSRRVFGENGLSPVLLRSNGELMWTAPSRDSSIPAQVSSVQSLSPGKSIVTRADWLPSHGQLYESGDRVYCIAGPGMPRLWAFSTNDELPREIDTPPGYDVLGASDKSALLMQTTGGRGKLRLFTYPMP